MIDWRNALWIFLFFVVLSFAWFTDEEQNTDYGNVLKVSLVAIGIGLLGGFL